MNRERLSELYTQISEGAALLTGGAVPIAQGGTAAMTAEEALQKLGAASAGHGHAGATPAQAGFLSAADKTGLDALLNTVPEEIPLTLENGWTDNIVNGKTTSVLYHVGKLVFLSFSLTQPAGKQFELNQVIASFPAQYAPVGYVSLLSPSKTSPNGYCAAIFKDENVIRFKEIGTTYGTACWICR